MDVLSNKFEKGWFFVFTFLYGLIMLPLPWYYSQEYIPSYFGVPSYIYGWILHAFVVLGAIAIFASQCLKRPEYHDLPEYKTDSEA